MLQYRALIVLAAVTAGVANQEDPGTWNTVSLARAKGYICEEHVVKTDDGYFIKVHRVLNGKLITRPPILLMHGFLTASDSWVMTPGYSSLPLLLANKGYDVWLGNVRGNVYGKKHEILSPKDSKFWDFSFHEIGLMDLPAIIDYILRISGTSQLYYIGHSMGTTVMFVLLSRRPEYNTKIKLMIALAPVSYLGPINVPGVEIAIQYRSVVTKFLDSIGVEEVFLPRSRSLEYFTRKYCSAEAPTFPLCLSILILAHGEDLEELNKMALHIYMANSLSGGSKKTLLHFSQLIASGKFQEFDYGLRGNLQRYNSAIPPVYDLRKITAPVSLHYSSGDRTVNINNVRKMYAELANPVGMCRVPHTKFNHIDFIIAKHAKSLLYDDLLKILEREILELIRVDSLHSTLDHSYEMIPLIKNVHKMYAELANPVGMCRVPHTKFNHIDFIIAKHAKSLLYDDLLKILERY